MRIAVALAILMGGGCRAAETRPASAEAVAPADAACDLAAQVVDDALGAELALADTPMSNLLEADGDEGCRLTAVGSFADLPEEGGTPVDLLWDSFDESGWHEDPRYAADTDETSAVGMWKGGVLCVMGAVWAPAAEYEEDREPTEEELRYDVMVECAPAGPPSIPLRGPLA